MIKGNYCCFMDCRGRGGGTCSISMQSDLCEGVSFKLGRVLDIA